MVYRRQRMNNRRMMQCTQIWRIVLIFLTICGRFKRVHDGAHAENGRGLASGSAWWIVRLLDTHRWRTIMCAPLPSDWVSSCCVYDLFMFFSFTLLFNQIIFLFFVCLESIVGDSASRVPVSEWVTFPSVLHYIGFAFSSFCLSQLSHYFVTCIPKT
jgi:hypothetical protein